MSRTATAPLLGFDGLEPRGAVAAANARQQFFQHFAQIADQGNIDLDVLVDLGGIDFDVNLLGLGGVGSKSAGHAIVEAHAAGDQQVGFLNGVDSPTPRRACPSCPGSADARRGIRPGRAA